MLLFAALITFAPNSADVSNIERQIVAFTNAERAERGLHELAADSGLQAAARRHSQDMHRRDFFDHTNPDGEGPSARVAREDRGRRRFAEISENIWMGTGYPPERIERIAGEVVAAWMKSAGHRGNVLRGQAQLIGVGVMVAGGRIYATEVFARVQGR